MRRLVQMVQHETQISVEQRFAGVILSIAAANYERVVLNYIQHMQRLSVSNYLIVCVDADIYRVINDTSHSILLETIIPLQFPTTSAPKQSTVTPANRKYSHIGENFFKNELKKISKQNSRKGQYSRRQLEINDTSTAQRNDTALRAIILSKVLWHYSKQIATEDRSSKSVKGKNKDSEAKIHLRYVDCFQNRLRRIVARYPFAILMLLKHSVISSLLAAGIAVVWSDIDCIWLNPCVLDTISVAQGRYQEQHHLSGSLDFAAQQGLFPYDVSHILGASICTGLLIVNPTNASRIVFGSVRDSLLDSLLSKFCDCKGDQKVINTMLIEITDIQNVVQSSGKLIYGDDENSSLGTEFQTRSASIRPSTAAKFEGFRRKVSNSLNLTFALLPYAQFPRGDARTGAQHTDSNIVADKLAYQMLQRNQQDWTQRKASACVWHMFALKTASNKIETMRRDGVV
jgi:hypothetical protein